MMLEPIHLYCERLGPGVWDEPYSLLASASFLILALAVWRGAAGLVFLKRMSVSILVLGLASMAQHAVPSRLTLVILLVAVLILVLGYFHAVNRDMLGMSRLMALVCTLLILPFAAVSLPLIGVLEGASSSLAYAALPVMLLGYAALLRPDHPATARGLSIGAAIMIAGLCARSLDRPLCDRLPSGTHFLWILAVAWLLWHLARVYRSHMLAARAAGR